MAITKMTLVDIKGNKSKLDEVLLKCIGTGVFNPEQASALTKYARGISAAQSANTYQTSMQKLTEIADCCKVELTYEDFDGLDVDNIVQHIEQLHERTLRLAGQRDEYQSELKKLKTASQDLKHLMELDLPLKQLGEGKYLTTLYGSIPSSNAKKLTEESIGPFVFFECEKEEERTWGLCITLKKELSLTQETLSSVGFQASPLDMTLDNTPKELVTQLESDSKQVEEKLKLVETELNDTVCSEKQRLCKIYARLKAAMKSLDVRRYAVYIRDEFHLIGFVPTDEINRFVLQMELIDTVEVTATPAEQEQEIQAPVKLKSNRLVKPFEMFIDMYGLPGYNEMDPTPFVALTYTILFGIMFGDLGQGLVMSLVGWFMSRKNGGNFGKILVRIGFSSAIFGFLYGSVFGIETLLDPFYINVLGMSGKPIHVMDPDTISMLLIAAIAVGAIMILASMLMNVALGIKQKDYEKALFSHNGLAGIVLYGSILVGAACLMLLDINLFTIPYIVGLIVLPVLLIFLKHPLANLLSKNDHLFGEEGAGGYLSESGFEMFEILLSYATNTMSFLRVGGFIISHAGMMAVVMTLTEMMNSVGGIVMLVFGNIFVMCLEGFIVGIAGLRLEFYEMFSRYYNGGGEPYRPVSVYADND